MAFNIDLSNPEELAAKLPELQRIYEGALEQQGELNEYIEYLRRLLAHASGVSRGRLQPATHISVGAVAEQPRRRAAPAQDRAVQALEQASAELGGSALGPTSLYKYMMEREMDAPKDAGLLGTNLHDAWKAGRIMRAPNGVYTPLDGTGRLEWDRPLTDYFYAAEMGFPLPRAWSSGDR
jgi:hypothetical protein